MASETAQGIVMGIGRRMNTECGVDLARMIEDALDAAYRAGQKDMQDRAASAAIKSFVGEESDAITALSLRDMDGKETT